MAHLEQREFVRLVSESMSRYFHNTKVLEIGSLDINGSVREYFNDCEFIGIDIDSGKNVDIVCQGQDYDAPNESFDQVICCEVLEHNPFWLETFNNMIRMTKRGGLVLMSCATIGRAEHGTTRSEPHASPLSVNLGWNYYRNLKPNDFLNNIDMSCFSHYIFLINWKSFDLYFCGIKKGSNIDYIDEWNLMINVISNYVNKQNNSKLFSYKRMVAKLRFRFMNS